MHIGCKKNYIFLTLILIILQILGSSCGNGGSSGSGSLSAWGTAVLLETNNYGDANTPRIAMDGNGNAIAVWSQLDEDSTFSIYASYYNGSGWSAAELIDSEDYGNAYDPRIVMHSSGSAVAVWSQYEETQFSIYANYFDGKEWDTAEPVYSSEYNNGDSPQISMDDSGNVLIVWQQYYDDLYRIFAGYYNGAEWGSVAMIDAGTGGNAYSPQVDVDGNGNAVSIWQQRNGDLYRIYASYFNGTSWGTAVLIDAGDAGSTDYPELAVNDTGSAVAVWQQYDGDLYRIYANRFNGISWGTAEAIDAAYIGDSDSPQISIDDTGSAVAVWRQFDGIRYTIYTNYFNGISWSIAGAIDSVDGGDSFNPEVAMNGSGSAMAVWSQFDSYKYRIRANYFDGISWNTVELIDYEDGGGAYYPEIAMDDSGAAIAVWPQFEGTRFSLYTNQYR